MTRRELTAAFVTPQVAAALQHAAHMAGNPSQARLTYFDKTTAAEVEALTAQIIPSDETAGAKEAGVVYFIDRALATFDRNLRGVYRDGLSSMQATRRQLFPASKSIASLSTGQAIQLVTASEKTEFFELLRKHTIMGFLGNPSYGGNRGMSGWKAIGFEDRHVFKPPFGYYDDPGNEGSLR